MKLFRQLHSEETVGSVLSLLAAQYFKPFNYDFCSLPDDFHAVFIFAGPEISFHVEQCPFPDITLHDRGVLASEDKRMPFRHLYSG